MATMPAATMTLEEYLRTSFDPDVDFVDGDLEERKLGEWEHGRLQALLAMWAGIELKPLGFLVSIEQRMHVAQNQVRICDLCVVSVSAPRERVLNTPPFICIEILSPEDRFPRAEKVLADYAAWGVQHIWLIDPIQRAAYRFEGGELQKISGQVLLAGDSGIRLDLAKIFAEIDGEQS